MQEHAIIVKWRAGLHARRAVDLVKISNKFQSKITLRKGDLEADAKSIISIMTLEASYKSHISISIEGVDEKHAIKAIVELFNNIN